MASGIPITTCANCGRPCVPDDAWMVRGFGACCRAKLRRTGERARSAARRARAARATIGGMA